MINTYSEKSATWQQAYCLRIWRQIAEYKGSQNPKPQLIRDHQLPALKAWAGEFFDNEPTTLAEAKRRLQAFGVPECLYVGLLDNGNLPVVIMEAANGADEAYVEVNLEDNPSSDYWEQNPGKWNKLEDSIAAEIQMGLLAAEYILWKWTVRNYFISLVQWNRKHPSQHRPSGHGLSTGQWNWLQSVQHDLAGYILFNLHSAMVQKHAAHLHELANCSDEGTEDASKILSSNYYTEKEHETLFLREWFAKSYGKRKLSELIEWAEDKAPHISYWKMYTTWTWKGKNNPGQWYVEAKNGGKIPSLPKKETFIEREAREKKESELPAPKKESLKGKYIVVEAKG